MILDVTTSWVIKESKIIATVKLKRAQLPALPRKTHKIQYYSFSFLRKNEIRDYFYVIGWQNYKFE